MKLRVFHKFAYYGNAKRFKEIVSGNYDLIGQYLEYIYYCITVGCQKNLEFAEHISSDYKFIGNRYWMAITTTYLRNGVFNDKLEKIRL